MLDSIDFCLVQWRKVAVCRSVPLISKKKNPDLKIYIMPNKQTEVAQSERVAHNIRTPTAVTDIQCMKHIKLNIHIYMHSPDRLARLPFNDLSLVPSRLHRNSVLDGAYSNPPSHQINVTP